MPLLGADGARHAPHVPGRRRVGRSPRLDRPRTGRPSARGARWRRRATGAGRLDGRDGPGRGDPGARRRRAARGRTRGLTRRGGGLAPGPGASPGSRGADRGTGARRQGGERRHPAPRPGARVRPRRRRDPRRRHGRRAGPRRHRDRRRRAVVHGAARSDRGPPAGLGRPRMDRPRAAGERDAAPHDRARGLAGRTGTTRRRRATVRGERRDERDASRGCRGGPAPPCGRHRPDRLVAPALGHAGARRRRRAAAAAPRGDPAGSIARRRDGHLDVVGAPPDHARRAPARRDRPRRSRGRDRSRLGGRDPGCGNGAAGGVDRPRRSRRRSTRRRSTRSASIG